MIQLIVFIFINSALLANSKPTNTILPTNKELSNKSHDETPYISDIIADDQQKKTKHKLYSSKDFSPKLLKWISDIEGLPSNVNKNNKIITDDDNKQKITRGILGELIITLDHFFEDNYNELEQYSKLYWNTYQLIKDQIEEMQFTKSSMQRLLEKYDNINFNE